MKTKSRRLLCFGGVVCLFVLFFPVRLAVTCSYEGDVGRCTDEGVSLVGIRVPPTALMLIAVAIPFAVLVYIGWRFDRKANARRDQN